jgi:hypothetical protein
MEEWQMRNALWTWILVGVGGALIATYTIITYMDRNPSMPMPVQPETAAPPAVEPQKTGNPLLTADKAAVSRWFPGSCFAEIYNKDPSFGGKLVPSCMQQVIRQIKGETGTTLTEKDIRAPEVFEHFKKVYGNDGLWLR